MDILNNDQIGKIAEMQFEIDCAKRGYCTSWPRVDRAGYDCILDTGDSLLKVQIKSSNRTNKSGQYKLSLTKSRGGLKLYNKDHFDIAAMYLHGDNSWYFIPFDIIAGLKGVGLNPGYSGSKYNKYKENWDIFKDHLR